jgi:hypothetical protein
MLNAVDSRKANDSVIIGAMMASRTDGRAFQEVVGLPSEKYTTIAAAIDRPMIHTTARKMGHCEDFPRG